MKISRNYSFNDWVKQIMVLSEIAKSEPQAAYTAFTAGFINKFTYHIRVIDGIELTLKPVDDAITQYLIPALTDGHRCSPDERELLALPVRLGGLAIPILHNIAALENENSKRFCKQLTSNILKQEIRSKTSEDNAKVKLQISKERDKLRQNVLQKLRSSMNEKELRANDLAQKKGASNWLTALPLQNENFHLSKREFFDAIATRYRWSMKYLPVTCACSKSFTIDHALSCPKGGFVYQRHNELRDTLAAMIDEVCQDVKIEPDLESLTGEQLNKGAIETDGARSDISARGFWVRGQRAFFDIRVFNPYAQRYSTQSLKTSFTLNENEKKRKYNRRIIDVERGSFTPLVFTINGGMGRECESFIHALSTMLAEKRDESLNSVINWVRTKISFALTRSTVLCI